MNVEYYALETTPDFFDYEFLSIGPKGNVRKIIRFSKVSVHDAALEVYNLGFGDGNHGDNKINDLIVTDNKDAQKILATVAAAIVSFTDHNPDVLVFAQGSTPTRTRYYVMGVSANLESILKVFHIWGHVNNRWEMFQRNKRYTALLMKRK